MSNIVLKNWYQLDFKIKNPAEDLKKIDSAMEKLRLEKLLSKWFFLYEKKTIRVRVKSKDKESLYKRLTELVNNWGLEMDKGFPFSDYTEDSKTLFNEEVVERFASVMSEITQLTIKKLKSQISFDNYRVMERISHCLFNNMGTLAFKSEEHFLVQRFKERTRLPFDGDFENKIIKKKKNGK